MKKITIVFFAIGIVLFLFSIFYSNIVEFCNINTISIKSESSILKIWGVMFVLSGIAFLMFKRYMSENFKLIQALIAFVLSASFAMILYSFLIQWSIWMFGTGRERPIANSASAIALFVSTVIFISLLVLYCISRKREKIRTDILLDVVIFLVYIIPFIFTYLAIHGIISDGLVVYYASIR